jgi:hypothetical protein
MTMGPLVEYLTAVVFTGVGSVIVTASAIAAVRGLGSKAWPRTDAVVIVSGVEQRRDAEGGRLYRVNIRYRFLVADSETVGARVYFGDWLELPFSVVANRLTRRFPVGSHVTVSYNRKRPEDSVLHAGVHMSVLYGTALGGVFIWLGLLALLNS